MTVLAELVCEALLSHGGEAKLDQIYEYVDANQARFQTLAKDHKKNIRSTVWRLKKKGFVNESGPERYKLVRRYHSPSKV